ncbi:MAG: hypothetical protein ACREAA_12720 [Candidatus Polarisedimenticolia bacterium]
MTAPREAGFFGGLVKDGRPLLSLTGLALVFSGCFALFLSATQQFLPHDTRFLGTSAHALCSVSHCRIVYFMFHDRVAFGGSIMAIGLLYLWLAEFPLGRGEAWAWWTFLVSGSLGFGSFLSYLGYGYLDSWHGIGTLALLPVFAFGLVRARTIVKEPRSFREALRPAFAPEWGTRAGIGRLLLLCTALGMVLGGATIMVVGMTSVFVPQDLEFMKVTPADLHSLNPRLIPLIAHDRAGFGGGLFSCGLAVLMCVWCGRPSRSLWQVLGVSGVTGFGTAIGVHFAVGYLDLMHLAPAYAGLMMYLAGLILAAPTYLAGAQSR